MNRYSIAGTLLSTLALILATNGAHATLLQINPVDADSIKPNLDVNYNSKSYVYSYFRDNPIEKHVGYLKFDLSKIPAGSTINSLSLQLYSQLNTVTPGSVANIYRTSVDSWSSTTQDAYPGTNELLGADQVISKSFSPYTWTLDVNAFNYQTDLTDHFLSLGITSPGYFNWFAIDGLNFPQYPLLSIDYTVGVPPTLGDANGDHLVDGVDYTIWADHFLLTTTLGAAAGDFSGDNKVDGADYTIWADHFAPGLLSISAVPEPSTLVLAVIGTALIAQAWRRRT